MRYPATKIDWNAFQYIFSTDPRTAFQQLAEQLFCFEFHQPYGIYRYYNQPYVETMPIHYGGAYIGFQAKYYDAPTDLSSQKGEIIASITGANQKYPGIGEIVFYINKEPGISTVKGTEKPSYIQEIETHGNALGIRVVWRGLNQMETMLLQPELEHLRDYFFAANGGIRQTLDQLRLHTKSIFDSIAFDIPYEGRTLKVIRERIDFKSFLDSDYDVLLVYGEGGCGKSGLVKDQLGSENRFPIWLFRATDFDSPSIPEFTRKFGDCTWDDLLSAFDSAPQKICIIDSAEKVFTIEHQETFEDAVRLLRQHGWRMVITIRTGYKDNFLNTVLRTTDVTEHMVKKLTAEEIMSLETDNDLHLPSDIRLRDFLCNLFYLKLYLSRPSISASNSVMEFQNKVWDEVICASAKQTGSLHLRRGQMICRLVCTNADEGTSYYVPRPEDDWEALTSLADEGIIHHDETMGGFFVTHDVYEEIVFKHILSRAYHQKQSTSGFFRAIGDSLVMRKAFRLWLHDQFEDGDDKITCFLSDVLTDGDVNAIWKDEILIALMGENNIGYPPFLDGILKEQKYQLFIRALVLLNTACRAVDAQLWQQVLTKEEVKTYNIYRYTKPAGSGWDYLIPYAYAHREDIPWSPVVIMLTADVLYTWTSHTHDGVTTRNAGLMALYLYQLAESKEYHYRLRDGRIGRISNAILNSAKEILPELTTILEAVITEGATYHRDLYSDLCEYLLSNTFECGTVCAAAPDLVIRLAKCFWLEHEASEERWYHRPDISEDFGLSRRIEHEYFPESAFQTPIFALLQAAPLKAIDFIIELFNTTTEAYKNSSLNTDYAECSEMEIIFPNGDRTMQTVSRRLWQMYRGTSVAPALLKSILMALERWFYFGIPTISEDIANHLCIRLLSMSHSAAITAVVASMVTAYPDKLFRIACILLHTKEIFLLDIARLTSEREVNYFKGLNPRHELYDKERISSNALPFRKKRLEDIILGYQLGQGALTEEDHQKQLQKLYQVIDESFGQEENLDENEQFSLYRMDLRKMKLVRGQTEKAGQIQLALVSNLPENLLQAQQKLQKNTKNYNRYIQLFLWSQSRFKNEPNEYKKYDQYEADPQSALTDARFFQSEPCSFQVDDSVLIYVSAVLLRDFEDRLDGNSVQVCANISKNHLQTVIGEQQIRQAGDGTDAAIAALSVMIVHREEEDLFDDPAVLLLMLMCDWDKQRDWAIQAFRKEVWHTNPIIAQNMLTIFILLKPEYDKEVSWRSGSSPFAFFETNESLIRPILEQREPRDLPDFGNLSETALQSLNLLLPVDVPLTRIVLSETGKLFWLNLFADKHNSDEEHNFRDMEQERAYLEWLAKYLLCSEVKEQHDIVLELAPYLAESEMTNDLLTKIVLLQDQLKKTQSFWNLWGELFETVERLCVKEKDNLIDVRERDIDQYYGGELGEILTTYLLAFPWWRDGAHSWHSLRREDAGFFAKAAIKFGYHPGTLYSIARVLNTIGYDYLDEGIKWLAVVVRESPHLRNSSLQVNTEYYIEEYVQRFITTKRTCIKRNPELRRDMLDVLSFLVDRGSTCGFMLRESIC